MKTKTLLVAALAAGCCLAQGAAAPDKGMPKPAVQPDTSVTYPAAIEGAALGQWTMDADAAFALAKKEGKPIFLNFTGSDWCGWCKLMEGRVFSQPAWKDYASRELVLVWVDSPRDKRLVPEAIVPKNAELLKKYSVMGFPTYVLLSSEGEELGRLGASQTATPESFVGQVEGILVLQRIDKLLSAEDFAGYEALKAQKKELEEKFSAWQTAMRKEGETFQTAFAGIGDRLEAYVKKAVEASKK